MKIKVNEIFGPTIQGEGKSGGLNVAFVRLSGCNLHCIWCDTPHTWNWVGTDFAHPDKYVKEEEEHLMDELDIFQQIVNTRARAVVISGGEPFIQQKQLIPLLKILKAEGYWVEVETNGTVLPREEFMNLVDQVNCSPKLANALDPEKLRHKPQALTPLAKHSKVNFKFVIQTEEDLTEVLGLIERYGMQEVRLMPECRTREELVDKEPWLRKVCEERGFIYCTRLSIMMSGTKRGV